MVATAELVVECISELLLGLGMLLGLELAELRLADIVAEGVSIKVVLHRSLIMRYLSKSYLSMLEIQ